MASEETPESVREKCHEVIDRLNASWDLRIPKSIERKIDLSRPDDDEKARRCYGRIRFLCDQPHSAIDRVLKDFDEHARQISSSWVWKKGSQDKGTLPSLPQTKSWLRRDALSKSTQPGLTDAERQDLILCLYRSLDDEYRLSRDSDVYNRTGGNSTLVSQAIPALRTSSAPNKCVPVSQPVQSASTPKTETPTQSSGAATKPAKRKASVPDHEPAPVKRKSQRSIRDMLQPFANTVPVQDPTPRSTTTPAIAQSFETMPSPALDPVFSPNPSPSYPLSNDTSFLSEEEDQETQDYFPTQEAIDFCESFQEELDDNSPLNAQAEVIMKELVQHGPCAKTQSKLLCPMPFGLRYEIQRIARAIGRPMEDLWQEVKGRCRKEMPTYDELWQAIRAVADDGSSRLLMPEKSTAAAWASATGTYDEKGRGRSVMLSGSLDWCEPTAPGLLKLQLTPMHLDLSCRLHRRFGADRFMVLTMPPLSGESVPSDTRKLRQKPEVLHEAVRRWLATCNHHIAGRVWRAFFLEVSKTGKKGGRPHYKIFMFAVDGDDFGPQAPNMRLGGDSSDRRSVIAMEEFIDWFMPIQDNIQSTDLKLFQRFALGLSKTEATVVLEPHEFIYVPDRKGTDGQTVMDDGCGRMSAPLAGEISRMLGLEKVPSAFQGRISGAKGLWMVEFDDKKPRAGERAFWIEVSDSQLKIKPHPALRLDADAENRTFEVLRCSGDPKPASLNIQFMTGLAQGGVPKELLQERFELVTDTYFKELKEVMHKPLLLRAWNQKYRGTNHGVDQMKWTGAIPDEKADRINLLLDSGFRPDECAILLKALSESLTGYLQRSVDKLAITLELSTSVWCIPDPYGVLQPGEVCLNFSRSWTNPKTGKLIRSLHGLQVLVSRSPALLPSDMQKVQGVSRYELEHITDVIIFSTLGDRPLASLLSGGDYDGDLAFVCFDPDIVNAFHNSDMDPSKLPGPEACGLINKSRKLSDFFKIGQAPSAHGASAFLLSAFDFNLRAPMLGICASEWEKLVYAKGLAYKGTIKLAALAGHLVDSSKQGYLLTNKAWSDIRKSCCGDMALPVPAYKESDKRRNKANNVVDYLKLTVAEEQKNNILIEFEKAFPPVPMYYDKPLSGIWYEYKDLAKAEEKEGRPELGQILNQLDKDVRQLHQCFAEGRGKAKDQDKRFQKAVASMHDAVLAIKPLPVQHQVCVRFERQKHQQYTEWSRIRASCIYYRHYRNVWFLPFYAAGWVLCRIKAETVGPTQLVTASSYQMMKIDGKAVKRKYGREELDEDDAFVDAEQEMSFMDRYFGEG